MAKALLAARGIGQAGCLTGHWSGLKRAGLPSQRREPLRSPDHQLIHPRCIATSSSPEAAAKLQVSLPRGSNCSSSSRCQGSARCSRLRQPCTSGFSRWRFATPYRVFGAISRFSSSSACGSRGSVGTLTWTAIPASIRSISWTGHAPGPCHRRRLKVGGEAEEARPANGTRRHLARQQQLLIGWRRLGSRHRRRCVVAGDCRRGVCSGRRPGDRVRDLCGADAPCGSCVSKLDPRLLVSCAEPRVEFSEITMRGSPVD